MSYGVTSVSECTTLIDSVVMPSVSAQTCAIAVSEP